jgi:hypothetical protein
MYFLPDPDPDPRHSYGKRVRIRPISVDNWQLRNQFLRTPHKYNLRQKGTMSSTNISDVSVETVYLSL